MFASGATNLEGSANPNGHMHIWLRDRVAGQTSLVSQTSAGQEADSGSTDFSIAPDGWGVIFGSRAANLDPLDWRSRTEINP